MHQAFFQHHFINPESLQLLLTIGFILTAVSLFLFVSWSVNFYSAALALSAIYNTIWGIVHHKYIDRNLTREIVYEYLAVLFVILVIVFSSTNFSQKVL